MHFNQINHNTPIFTLLSCRTLIRALLLLFFLSMNHSSAFASLYSPSSIRQLTQKSGLIVVGEVTSVEYFDKSGGNVQVDVEHVLKGELQNRTITISLPDMPLRIALNDVDIPMEDGLYGTVVIAKEYGIFFLQEDKDKFISVDPIHTILPIRNGLRFSDVSSTDALSLVRKELLYTALGPTVFSKGDKATIRFYQEAAKKFDRPKMADMYPMLPMNVRAVGYLAEPIFNNYRNVIPSHEHEAKALRALLSTNNSPTLLRGAVLTTLLTFGQFDVLNEAVKYVDAVQQMATSPQRARLSIQANNIVMAVRYVNGYQYVSALGNLLKSHHTEMRRSAATALLNTVFGTLSYDKPIKNLKDSVTLPFLIEALNDSDSKVRLRALQALPLAANKPSWQPPALVQGEIPNQEEERLISQWKKWWVDEGKKAFVSAA